MTYIETVWEGELGKLGDTKADRNDTLFKVASRLYEFANAHAWTEETATDELMRRASGIGLKAHEIRSTLKSARRHIGDGRPTDRAGRELDFSGDGTAVRASAPTITPPDPCEPPCAAWQAAAQAFLAYSQDQLWDGPDTALDTLEARGLNALTAVNAGLGHNPTHLTRSRARWGLEADQHGDNLYLPAGIVLPYIIDRVIYKIEIRTAAGKYTLPGSANALWGADRLSPGKPAQLVEGVFNALTIRQEAGDLVTPVALGAATHCRRVRWIAPLVGVTQVLVSTDAGKAGEDAAGYWLNLLAHNGRRWRPYTDDPNAMHTAGISVRDWVRAGLDAANS